MNNKKNICVVTTNLLIIKFFFLSHLEMLSKKYNVTLIVNVESKDFLESLVLNPSIRVVHIPIKRDISIFIDLWTLLLTLKHFLSNKYDLVLTVAPKAGLIGILSSWALRVKHRIHIFQGEVWVTQTGFKKVLIKTADILVAKLSTHLLVVSDSERNFLIKEKIIDEKKSTVLGAGSIQGVDLNRFVFNKKTKEKIRNQFNIAPDSIVFSYVGRIHPDKGISNLINAFTRLAHKNQDLDIHLLIVGPDEHGLDNFSINHEIKHKITVYKQYVHNPEDYMMASDVLVLPSYREGFGMVIIEAAAMKIPAIGNNIYGISDAIKDKVTGLLFNKSIEDLEKKMEQLLDQEYRHLLGTNAYLNCLKYFKQSIVINNFERYIINKLEKIESKF